MTTSQLLTCNCAHDKSHLDLITNQNLIKSNLKELEKNFEELLRSNFADKQNMNRVLLNTKKYSVHKKALEELVKIFPENKIFARLTQGFNEIFQDLLTECKVGKEKCDNFDILSSSKLL
jgi:hypothetical protein